MNVTLRIPDELGKRAKHLAVDEGKSLSALMAELLEEKLISSSTSDYRNAQNAAWELMNKGLSGASKNFKRDDLYDRNR
jgi:predicted DNA-binding protein